MTQLKGQNLTIAERISGVDFCLEPGQLWAVLGPNGAGKSSLIKGLLGLTPLDDGWAQLDDHPVSSLSPKERARQVAYLPQSQPLAWPNRVIDLVSLGRFAYGAGRLSETDSLAVNQAMEDCSLTQLATRPADELSGGELARVHFARALAAQTPLLVVDEPTAALDASAQFQVMDLIEQYVGRGGGALVVMHDLSLAAQYASHVLWLKDGRCLGQGETREMLTEAWIDQVYGVRSAVSADGVLLTRTR